MEPNLGINQEGYRFEQTIKNSGFSEARFLRKGASGLAYFVREERSGQVALLKMSPKVSGQAALTLHNELDVVTEGRRETRGLNQIAGYPLAEVPAGVILEPTMRGSAGIRRYEGFFRIDGLPAILLEWIEETSLDRRGYHRLDKLVPEKFRTWTDLEILDLVVPFAYLLAQCHRNGVIYSDADSDKADHFYYDENVHQLKVIDWANVIFTTDANYNGARGPYHDIAGLARLIYHMRTNEDRFRLERDRPPAELLRDNLLRENHPILSDIVYKSLSYFQNPQPDGPFILDGVVMYAAIEAGIRTLREPPPVAEPGIVIRGPQPQEPKPRIVINKPTQQRPDRIVIRRPDVE